MEGRTRAGFPTVQCADDAAGESCGRVIPISPCWAMGDEIDGSYLIDGIVPNGNTTITVTEPSGASYHHSGHGERGVQNYPRVTDNHLPK